MPYQTTPGLGLGLGLCLMLPGLANAAEICVQNSSGQTFLFAAEAHGGVRRTARLKPGESLCVSGDNTGVVSVFEHAGMLEGCSRLVTAANPETLLRYVDFDRCFWSSNSN